MYIKPGLPARDEVRWFHGRKGDGMEKSKGMEPKDPSTETDGTDYFVVALVLRVPADRTISELYRGVEHLGATIVFRKVSSEWLYITPVRPPDLDNGRKARTGGP